MKLMKMEEKKDDRTSEQEKKDERANVKIFKK